jgi:hypothetical protein
MDKTSKIVYGSVLLAVILIVLVYTGLLLFDKGTEFRVNVSPTVQSGKLNAILLDSSTSRVEQRGKLVLKDPDLLQKMFWPSDNHLADFFELVFIFLITIRILLIFRNYNDKNVFRNKIHKHIKWVGQAFILYYCFNVGREIFVKRQVLDLTASNFMFDESFNHRYQLLVAILLFWLSRIIKRGFKLQREQDLTI